MICSFLRYLTWKRLRNELRCRFSYALSLLGAEHCRHMPTFASLEPADYCMLRCPQCPVGMRGEARREAQNRGEEFPMKSGEMDFSLCCRAIDELAPEAHTVIFHFQGEPLLNRRLPEMIAYAHSRRLFTMLSTNAQTLDGELAEALVRSGLDRIIVSVDGLTQPVYAHYRVGGSLERALVGMRMLAEKKKEFGYGPEIVMQCLYLRSNEHQWAEIRSRYRELGADRLEMKTAQFYDFENGHPDMPSDARYARYVKAADGRYRLKKQLRRRCYRLWSGCVITAEGVVLPCCFDKDHSYPLGSLADQPLRTILHGPKARSFRRAVLSGRESIGICTNCTE